jgi:hypothetical protein
VYLQNLPNETTYTFTITTRVNGTAVGSATYDAVTTCNAPGDVTDLSGTLSYPTSANITWTPTTNSGGVIRHQVVIAEAYDTFNERSTENDIKQSYFPTTISASVYPLIDGYTYKVYVYAVNDRGYTENPSSLTFVNNP